MSTYTLGFPYMLRDRLVVVLPKYNGISATVRVTSRGKDNRSCPAWDADRYEIHAFYSTQTREVLAALQKALDAIPGVFMTTLVTRGPDLGENVFSNPDWPERIGTRRRGRDDLRPQVLALISDP